MLLHAPAARPAVEHVGVVEEAIEERADGGDVAEELAPVLDRSVRAENLSRDLDPVGQIVQQHMDAYLEYAGSVPSRWTR